MLNKNFQNTAEEISDFCSDYKEKNRKHKKYLPFLAIFLFIFLAFFVFVCIEIPKTPEYSIYKACVSIKNNNYEDSLKYINIDKIVDNRINAIKKDIKNSPELKDNPFMDLAYIFMDALANKLKEAIKIGFREIVESKNNVFQDVSEIKLAYFLIIKSYNNLSLKKNATSDNETIFTFSDNDKYDNLKIILNKPNKTQWEIVDIVGYEFWKKN